MTAPACPAGASCYMLDVDVPQEPQGQLVHLNGEDVRLRAGALEVRLGCGIESHKVLGWCMSCPRITPRAEVLAWRLRSAGYPTPDHEWARAISS